MTDFFADLEAQLRTAHGRRPSALRRAARPVALVATLLAVAGGALGLAVALSGGGARERAAAPPPVRPILPEHGHPVPIVIRNGTTVPGLARRIADRLAADGFEIARVDNAPRRDIPRTSIAFRDDGGPTAAGIADVLGVSLLVKADSGPKVTIVLGADARGPLPVAPRHILTTSLRCVDPTLRASAIARIVRDAGILTLRVRVSGLPRGSSYGVWLTASDRGEPDRFLGFTPDAAPDGTLNFVAGIPSGAPTWTVLVITRESASRPTAPGPVVLKGRLRYPAP